MDAIRKLTINNFDGPNTKSSQFTQVLSNERQTLLSSHKYLVMNVNLNLFNYKSLMFRP